MAARLEAEKFTGKNDFALWRMNIRAMLTQQGLSSALTKEKEEKEGEAADEKAIKRREEIEAKAFSTIILCLGDSLVGNREREENIRYLGKIRGIVSYKIASKYVNYEATSILV